LLKRIFGKRGSKVSEQPIQAMEISQNVYVNLESKEKVEQQNQNRKKEIKKIRKYVLHEPKL